MKKIFTLFAVLLCSCMCFAQPYAVGKRTQTFVDPSRSNRSIATDIYYPATSAGNNVPVINGTDSFPVVVFGHGFLINTDAYKWLSDSLVKKGYIVALPTTEGGILPSHGDFGADLAFLCSAIAGLDDSTSSFLFQRVIKKAAVGGHSMGGGASFLAAAGNKPSIYAVFNFAAAETSPSATTAASTDFKPTLIFSGSGDCIAAPTVQQAMYNNIVLPCKTYINITNGLHCQFANNNGICTAGQFISGCNNSPITAATLFNKTTTLLIPFLDYYLKNICARGVDFESAYGSITGVTKQRSCLPYPACGVLPLTLLNFSGVLQNNTSLLKWSTAAELNIKEFIVERSHEGTIFTSFTTLAPRAANGSGASYSTVDTYPFSGDNFYRLKITDKDGSFSYSPIVHLVAARKQIAVTAIFPNPVDNFLRIQIQSEKYQQINFILYDISGKQVFTQKGVLNAGGNDQQIDFTGIVAGTYMLQCRNTDGTSVGIFKIVKK